MLWKGWSCLASHGDLVVQVQQGISWCLSTNPGGLDLPPLLSVAVAIILVRTRYLATLSCHLQCCHECTWADPIPFGQESLSCSRSTFAKITLSSHWPHLSRDHSQLQRSLEMKVFGLNPWNQTKTLLRKKEFLAGNSSVGHSGQCLSCVCQRAWHLGTHSDVPLRTGYSCPCPGSHKFVQNHTHLNRYT